MTADEYWHGDNRLPTAYRKAYYMKMERQSYESWLQGRYIYEAVSAVAQNALAKKGARKAKYPEEPYKVLPDTEADKKQKEEQDREKLIAMLNAWYKRSNKT